MVSTTHQNGQIQDREDAERDGEDERHGDEVEVCRVSGERLVWLAISLPLVGAVSCVLLSLILNFEGSTSTHCRPKVKNYLPSISSAVGDFTPQRYIWRACIALHSAPRLILGTLFLNYYLTLTVTYYNTLYKAVTYVTYGIYNMEIMALLTLTYISSSENFPVHENSFVMFMVFSLCHMLITCGLLYWGHHKTAMSNKARSSYRWSIRLFLINGLSFALAVYCYFRHQDRCEPGMYTLFALLEYVTVVTNICFHGCTGIILFGEGKFRFSIPTDAPAKIE